VAGKRTGDRVGEKPEERGVEGRIILKFILKNFDRMTWTEFIWVGVEKDKGCHKQGNVRSGSVKCC
jgi:hypothetical protein